MTFNAADRKDVRRAEKASKLAEVQRREVITQLMGTIAGRSWLHDLLLEAHVFATSLSEHSGFMYFSEGQRNIGLRLLNDIMLHCPEQYVTMMREANARNTAAERSSEPEPGRTDQGPTESPADEPTGPAEES